MANKLTDMQKRFVEHYMVTLNGSEAALRAGYSKDTARVKASTLLAKPHIKEELNKQQQKLVKKMDIKKEDIINRLNERAELVAQMQELALLDEPSELELEKLYRLQNIIKTSDANKSDEMLAKMLGFNEPEKSEVTLKSEQPLFKPLDDKEE